MAKAKNPVEAKEETIHKSGDAGPGREPAIVEEPETTFDERGNVAQPWLNEDGTQNTGE